MEPELFTILEQLSPRLEWLRRHMVTTHHYPQFDGDMDEDEFGNTLYPWAAVVSDDNKEACGNSDAYGSGMTEWDACVDLASKQGWAMWGQENFNIPQ